MKIESEQVKPEEQKPSQANLRKRYTPIILRFGFFLSYERTLLPTWTPIVIQYILLFYEGSIPLVCSTFPYTALWMFLGPLAIWTMRDTVHGFDKLFSIFNRQTERELRLHCSMRRTPTLAQQDIRLLFCNPETYESFRKKVLSMIFNQKELILIAFALCLYFIGVVVYLLPPTSWYYLGVTAIFWSKVVTFLFACSLLLVVVFCFGALHLFIGILRTIALIGKSDEKLRIWSYVAHLRESAFDNDEPMMSYEQFHTIASSIGRYVYHITFRVVFALGIAAILAILVDAQHDYRINPTTWLVSFGIVAVSFIVFVIPQASLHNVLARTKEAALNGLEQKQSRLKAEFINSLERNRQIQSYQDLRTLKHIQLRKDIDELRLIIKDTRKTSTWSFQISEVLKIFGTSLLPTITALVQMLFLVQ